MGDNMSSPAVAHPIIPMLEPTHSDSLIRSLLLAILEIRTITFTTNLLVPDPDPHTRHRSLQALG